MFSPIKISPLFNLPPSGGGGNPYIVAEGGTATRDGDYIVRTFLAGSFDLVVTSNLGGYSLEWLAGAGGGAGGGTNNGGAGGGGGGGVKTNSFIPTLRSYALTVGVGGVAIGRNRGTNGTNTTLETESGTETLIGGGGGGSGEVSSSGDAFSGGSAGGNGCLRNIRVATATSGQGNIGGICELTSEGGAGGGGADSIGLDAVTGSDGADGGDGLASLISGTLKYYGAGGGGGSYNNANFGAGGSSTGGNGGFVSGGLQSPTDPIVNSCSGGGGAANNAGSPTDKTGSNGADGIVIIRYLSPEPIEAFLYETILENNDY